MIITYKPAIQIAIGIALLLGAYLIGVKTTQPKPEDVTAVPQVTQSDGSIVIERKPEAKPTKAPHKIPKGSTEERRVNLKLKPDAFVSDDGCQCDPAPVSVNLSLVRDDQGRRVVASSPGGQIVGALDVPIEPALMPPEPHPWAAGLSYGHDKSAGAWIERDLGRIRVGAEVIRQRDQTFQGRVRVGWAW
jgi:hypothetical protein